LGHVPMIAIVEDDASVRVATECLVRSLGFVACTFASAEEFLQFPRLNDTSCVIADVQMPGMSGIELQSRLISLGRCTPIIFMTAFPEESIRARAMQAGAMCFLGKPVDVQRLIECLDKAVNGRDGA
jgi:FixJ family two-component response regulator